MSSDSSPIRSDSSSEDPDFKLFSCIDCQKECLGRNMNGCCNCDGLLCLNCEMIVLGCANRGSAVCKACFSQYFHDKRRYCCDQACDCSNGSPIRKAKERYRKEFERLPIRSIDKEAWKIDHPPINYPGKYTGRYLVDIATSSDDFERGYLDWLIKEGAKSPDSRYTKEQHHNFQHYVQEAKQLKQLLKPSRYNLRKRRVMTNRVF